MSASTIHIANTLGPSVTSRDVADILFDDISKCGKHVILDFFGVEFISRSFADQFHKRYLSSATTHHIKIANASSIVTDMLDAVKQTQDRRTHNPATFKSNSFKTKQEVADYLLSID